MDATPQNSRPPAQPLLRRGQFWLIWTGIGLFFALQWLPYRQRLGVSASTIILFALVYNYLWAGCYLPTALAVRPLLRSGCRLSCHLAAMIPLIVGTTLVHLTLYYAFYVLFRAVTGIDYYHLSWLQLVSQFCFFDGLLCLLLVAAGYLRESFRLIQERQERTARLEQELNAAQLQVLKMQLQPHFLFNTLNSIQALLDDDSRAAKQMINRLADFLRATLEIPPDGLIPLRREWELALSYLHIEQTRFADRLQVTASLPADLADCPVPALILQPLLENAVRHGIAPFLRKGWIRLTAQSQDGQLLIQLDDSGPGPMPTTQPAQGVGLANTRRRLQHHYGRLAGLTVSQAGEGGCRMTLRLPGPGQEERER